MKIKYNNFKYIIVIFNFYIKNSNIPHKQSVTN